MTAEEILKSSNPQIIRDFLLKDSNTISRYKLYEILQRLAQMVGNDNNNLLKQCFLSPEIGAPYFIIIKTIIASKNAELVEKCLKDTDIGFNSFHKLNLLIKNRDVNLMKKYLLNGDLGLEAEHKEVLLLTIIQMDSDIDFIKDYSKRNKLSKDTLTFLLLKSEEEKTFAKEYSQVNGLELVVPSNINLPENMTIGIEIESERTGENNITCTLPNWTVDIDDSLENGQENISPVLTPKNEDIREMYYTCYVLNKMGQIVKESCGGHVHIGAKYLDESKGRAYEKLLGLYESIEDIIYIISNEDKTILRKSAKKHYAKPIKNRNLYEKSKKEPDNESIKKMIIENQPQIYIEDGDYEKPDKFFSLNLSNLNSKNKYTVEFRTANSTLNPKVWIENINLFGSLIATARELADMDQKLEKLDEIKYYKQEEIKDMLKKQLLFERLQKKGMTQKQRLNFLLELLFDDPNQRAIYLGRYLSCKQLENRKRAWRVIKKFR